MEGEGEGVGIGVGVSLGFGVRKGAWTKDEDTLLTKCIEQYGEGKWHLVPSRAGLNRCRKSCRLRWLNYLKPSIKRGGFADDEVDLIIRLHNLLGNRWSLIAGRLPGRTANDIKNYWNSHLLKKMTSPHSKKIISKLNPNPNPNPNLNPSNPNNNMVIRPRPRRLSTKSFPLLQGKNNHDTNDNDVEDVTTNNNLLTDEVAGAGASAKSMNGEVPWWELLLMEDGNEVDNEQQKHQTVYHCHINNNNQSGSMGEEAFLNGPVVEEPNDICNWDLLFSDVDLWKGFT